MKKVFVYFVVLTFLSILVTGTSFAHGGYGRGQGQMVQRQGYALCYLEDCKITNSHQHDNLWYCGREGLEGEYEVCDVSDCDATFLHEHNGEYYHCKDYNENMTKCGTKKYNNNKRSGNCCNY